jgi:hypothetical protein
MILKAFGWILKIGILVAIIFIILGVGMLWFSDWNVKRVINDANYCNATSECITMYYNCPLDCSSYVNSAEVGKIKFYTSAYYVLHPKTCTYKCAETPTPLCRNNKCS